MRVFFLSVIFLGGVSQAFAAAGAGDVARGNHLYRQGKFKEAAEHYERALEKSPSEAKIQYDLGAVAYKSGEYDKAVEHFQKGLLTDDDGLLPDVHYNMGGAYYRSGMDKKDKDIQAAIKQLEKSLGSLEKARALDLKDKEAAENYEFVKKELERLKQQQQQQEQQKKEQQDKQDQSEQQAKDQDKKDPSKEDQPDGRSSDDQKKEDQHPEDQKKDQGQDQGSPEQKDASTGQNDDGKISSQKDADALVDELERNELPKGLLDFVRQPREMKPVEKDW